MTAESPPPPVEPRVALAVERTLLAWIRTGVALMGFGFVVARFALLPEELAGRTAQTPHGTFGASFTGVALVGAGITINLWAGVRFTLMLRRVARGDTDVVRLHGPITIVTASCIGGVLLVLVLLGAFGD